MLCVCVCVFVYVCVCVGGGGGGGVGWDSVIFWRAILIFLPSHGSKMSRYIFVCSKCWTAIFMGVFDASLIVSHENSCKIFSNNI